MILAQQEAARTEAHVVYSSKAEMSEAREYPQEQSRGHQTRSAESTRNGQEEKNLEAGERKKQPNQTKHTSPGILERECERKGKGLKAGG